MADATLLSLVLYLPVIGIAILMLLPKDRPAPVRHVTLWVMLVQLAITLVLYAKFDPAAVGLQFETRIAWIPAWGVSYQIGMDGFNVLMVLLTAFLGPLVVAGSFTSIDRDIKLDDGFQG